LATRETRKDLVAVRLQPSEKAHFAAICKEHGVTMSEGFRRLARAAGGLGPTFDGEAKAAIEELTAQTRAVGVNLNQIARAMNQGLVPPDPTFRKVLEDIASAIQAYDLVYVSMVARSRKLAVEALKDEQA
jgi:antitoxin component of RelBE/YafQ-DinJ toxin-antitoxin module